MASSHLTRRSNGEVDPFAPFRVQFYRMIEDFFGASYPGRALDDFQPAVDVSEAGEEFYIRADLPGVKECDVELSIEDDVLKIRGERRSETLEDNENHHLSERSYGRFERAMRLPFSPAENAIRAEFKDGVLSIVIKRPVGGAKSARRIEIGRR